MARTASKTLKTASDVDLLAEMSRRGIAAAAETASSGHAEGSEPDWRSCAAEIVADLAAPVVYPEGWDPAAPPKGLVEETAPVRTSGSSVARARKRAAANETPPVDTADLVSDLW